MSRLKEHLTQDASVPGALVAFGLSTAAVVGALMVKVDWNNDAQFVPAVVLGVTLFFPGPVVFAMRLRRPKKAPGQRLGARCELCGASPAEDVRYVQVIGIAIVALLREAKVRVCGPCSRATCKKMSLMTAAFGWWMLLTPLVVPWVLANNLVFFVRARRRLSSPTIRAAAFDEHAEYARNLLRTKDRATVVEVLRGQLNASDETVEAWLRTLE